MKHEATCAIVQSQVNLVSANPSHWIYSLNLIFNGLIL